MNNWQAAIIAVGIAVAGIGFGYAQVSTPSAINGCVYNSSPPTLTNKQTAPFSCDSTGKLRVTTSF